RPLREHDPERVEDRVVTGDPVQVELDELARGDLAGGDQLRLPGDSRVCELDGLHSPVSKRKPGPSAALPHTIFQEAETQTRRGSECPIRSASRPTTLRAAAV